MIDRKEKARLKLLRKAARGPGFSSYAKRRLNQLWEETAAREAKEDSQEAK